MSWLPYITMFLLGFVGLLLIFIILLQRGRGGGLAGALGGMGGQSAFGTKAGDVFTKITIGLATVWMLLAAGNVFALRMGDKKYTGGDEAVTTAPGIEATTDGDGKKSPDVDMDELKKQIQKLGETKVGDEPATETKSDDDKKPAEATTTPAKAPESTEIEKPATEKPAEDKKPAEEKSATPDAAAKTEKPAEPAKDGEKKSE